MRRTTVNTIRGILAGVLLVFSMFAWISDGVAAVERDWMSLAPVEPGASKRLMFPSGSNELGPEARAKLEWLASLALQRHDAVVLVTAYGSQGLAEARADLIEGMLLGFGVDAENIERRGAAGTRVPDRDFADVRVVEARRVQD